MAERAVPNTFLVAFSQAGEQKEIVRPIAEAVERHLGPSTVFLDEWYPEYVTGYGAGQRLQEIYSRRSELVVFCVSKNYENKPWTASEFSAIRERLETARQSDKDIEVMRIFP